MDSKKFYLLSTRSVGIDSPAYPEDTYYWISLTPGRTNQSGEVVVDGWLGTTDDIAEYAEGEYASFGDALAAIPDVFDKDAANEHAPETWVVVSKQTAAARRRHDRLVEQAHQRWTQRMDKQRDY